MASPDSRETRVGFEPTRNGVATHRPRPVNIRVIILLVIVTHAPLTGIEPERLGFGNLAENPLPGVYFVQSFIHPPFRSGTPQGPEGDIISVVPSQSARARLGTRTAGMHDAIVRDSMNGRNAGCRAGCACSVLPALRMVALMACVYPSACRVSTLTVERVMKSLTFSCGGSLS
jgi:hypothetical protein